MGFDARVARRYEVYDERARLWGAGTGAWVRLRTWDVLDRVVPDGAAVVDIGSGPGVHALHLAERGCEVVAIDPVRRHVVELADAAVVCGDRVGILRAEARHLPLADGSVDVAMLMGPLYHLVEPADRAAALAEAWRVLRPGGLLVAEVITRQAWLLDATRQDLLSDPVVAAEFDRIDDLGLSQDPDDVPDGSWWAYFHRIDDVPGEIEGAGFDMDRLIGVEGVPWLLGDLEDRLARDSAALLDTWRRVESEPSLLGVSPHVIALGRRPENAETA